MRSMMNPNDIAVACIPVPEHIMKILMPLVVAITVTPASAAALAQHVHAAPLPQAAVSTAGASLTYTDGVVKRVDKAGGRLTIAHDPIVNLDMPRMTMAFRVKDAAWLERVKEGDRIRFAAENPQGVLTVVALQTK